MFSDRNNPNMKNLVWLLFAVLSLSFGTATADTTSAKTHTRRFGNDSTDLYDYEYHADLDTLVEEKVRNLYQRKFIAIPLECMRAIKKSVEENGRCNKQAEERYYNPILESCQNCPKRCSPDDNVCAEKCQIYQNTLKHREEMKASEVRWDHIMSMLEKEMRDVNAKYNGVLAFCFVLLALLGVGAFLTFKTLRQQGREIQRRTYNPSGDSRENTNSYQHGQENGGESA